MLDACVLLPNLLRDIVTTCAEQGVLTPFYTPQIEAEWRHAAARHGPEAAMIAGADAARFAARFPKARFMPPQDIDPNLWLPDRHDIHVLHAAIAARCDVIMTFNLKDFPRGILADHQLYALHPDRFLCDLWPQYANHITHAVTQACHTARTLYQRERGQDISVKKLLKDANLLRLSHLWMKACQNNFQQ